MVTHYSVRIIQSVVQPWRVRIMRQLVCCVMAQSQLPLRVCLQGSHLNNKAFVGIRLRSWCCHLVGHFEHIPYSRRPCENITSSTKPEVHNALHYCQRSIEPRQQAAGNVHRQEAQLSPSDRAMRLVSSILANCHATVQKLKLLIRQVLTKLMVWSWRFNRRQCVMNNVHSTMTRPSRLPLSQVS